MKKKQTNEDKNSIIGYVLEDIESEKKDLKLEILDDTIKDEI